MRFTTVSDKGGRINNEDFLGHAAIGTIHCFVLCDGLGGHSSGETASELAVQTILAEFKKSPEISKKSIQSYISAANTAIYERQSGSSILRGMATTASVLLTDGKKAVWGNIGDTRLYRFSLGKIAEVTEDHSVAFMDFKKGKYEYKDIRTSPDQNKLTKSLGTLPDIDPDISEVIKINGTTSFLICTDGFWEYVNEAEMEKLHMTTLSSKAWLEKMLEIIAKKAPSDHDNLSAIAIRMQLTDFL